MCACVPGMCSTTQSSHVCLRVAACLQVLEQVVPLYEVQATHRGMPRGRRRTQGGEAGRGRGECTAGGKAESNSPDGGGLAADSSASLDV